MQMKKYLTIVTFCAAALLFTNPAHAQDIRSDVTGFYANVNITGGYLEYHQ